MGMELRHILGNVMIFGVSIASRSADITLYI